MKTFLHDVVTDKRQGPGYEILKAILWVFSLAYGGVVRAWRSLYENGIFPRKRLAAKVISVGNLTVGGTGKTPFVVFLTEMLKQSEIKPAVLTRGYGGSRTRSGKSDETAVMEAYVGETPVLAGKNRYAEGSRFLRSDRADCFILDDGFQHWKLARDLDIVLIDASRPWGGGYLLPRGLLREPKSALKHADICVLTRADHPFADAEELKKEIAGLAPKCDIFEARTEVFDISDGAMKKTLAKNFLSDRDIVAFCALGNPESFSRTLGQMGCRVRKFFAYPDHHGFTKKDIDEIRSAAKEFSDCGIVTTAKDAVKLQDRLNDFDKPDGFYVVHIRCAIKTRSEEFRERILSVLHD